MNLINTTTPKTRFLYNRAAARPTATIRLPAFWAEAPPVKATGVLAGLEPDGDADPDAGLEAEGAAAPD